MLQLRTIELIMAGALCFLIQPVTAQTAPSPDENTNVLQTVVISAPRLPEDPFVLCSSMGLQEDAYDMCVSEQIDGLWPLLPEPSITLPDSNYSIDANCGYEKDRVNVTVINNNESYSSTVYLPRVNAGVKYGFQASNGLWYSSYSGLTIGDGVDLQWFTGQQLLAWGVSATVVNYFEQWGVVAPSLGQRGMYGEGAYQFLQTPVAPGGYAANVTISSADIYAMDTGAMASEIATTAEVYYKLTGSYDFFFLPSNTQTGLVDLVYSGNFPAGGVLQADVQAFDWSKLTADAKGSSNTRVQADGGLFGKDVSSGQLSPDGSKCGL